MFGLRNSALLLVSIYLLSATDAFGSTSQQDGQEAVTDFTDRYTSKPPSRGVNIGESRSKNQPLDHNALEIDRCENFMLWFLKNRWMASRKL